MKKITKEKVRQLVKRGVYLWKIEADYKVNIIFPKGTHNGILWQTIEALDFEIEQA